ncbi:hypothetical protein [Euzebya pacifica]|uniref:hypothetical protein n=1 Tax=Euzebya pacifica TaxID=1608957 RepID=UPI0030F5F76A
MNITSTQSAFASQPSSSPPRGGGPFEDVSSLFGMSAREVGEKVRSGSSLETIADELGVAREDLYAALEAGAPDELQGSADLEAIVAEIASHSGPGMPGGPGGSGGPGGGRGPGGPPPPSGVLGEALTSGQSQAIDLLSNLMDISTDELTEELRAGTDLGALLERHDVDLKELAGALETGFLFDARA